MSPSKIEFDDAHKLTPDSREEIERRALEMVHGVNLEDEQIYQKILEIMEKEDDGEFFSEQLRNLIFEDLNLDYNLEQQYQIKKTFLHNFAKKISERAPARKKMTIDADIDNFDIQEFVNNLKKLADSEKNEFFLFSEIADSMAADILAVDTIKKNNGNFNVSPKELEQQLYEAQIIEKQIDILPESAGKDALKKRVTAIVRKNETLEKNLQNIEFKPPQKEIKTVEDQFDRFFNDIKKIIDGIKPDPKKDINTSDQKLALDDFLFKNQKLLDQIEKITKNVNLSLLEKADQDIINERCQLLKEYAQKIPQNLKNILDKDDYIGALDEGKAHKLKSELTDELIKPSGLKEKLKDQIKKALSDIEKIKPKNAHAFQSLEHFGAFYNLQNEIADLKNDIFGKNTAAENPAKYKKGGLYRKNLEAGQKIATDELKHEKNLRDFETMAAKEGAVLTDGQLLENLYTEELLNVKKVDGGFAKEVEDIVGYLLQRANIHKIEVEEDIASDDVPINIKLKVCEKIVEKLGGVDKLNPSLRTLYEKLKSDENNPEVKFQKLRAKSAEIDEAKKKLLDAKNRDILDSAIPQLKEDLKKRMVELRNLEIEIFGSRRAYSLRKAFVAQRKYIADSIGIDGEGNPVATIRHDLDSFLNKLRQEIKNTQEDLQSINDNVNKTKDETTAENLRAKYLRKEQYLGRLEEILEKKELKMQSYLLSQPEKANRPIEKFREAIKAREDNRFQLNGKRDKFFRSLHIIQNPLNWKNRNKEAKHSKEMDDLMKKELNLILETGYGPAEEYFSELRKFWTAPLQFFLKKSLQKRQEIIAECRKNLETDAAAGVEKEKTKIENLKKSHENIEHETDIWESANIRRALEISARLQKLYESGSTDIAQIEVLQRELKDLVKQRNDANKRLQDLIAPRFGDKNVENLIKETREKEQKTMEIKKKRFEELFQKFKEINHEKYYPNSQKRFEEEIEEWQKLAAFSHIPLERFHTHTIKPFFDYLRLHKKDSAYIFKPRDLLILLKMQNNNIANVKCSFRSSADFKKDFDYLKEKSKGKIKTVKDYLNYREKNPKSLDNSIKI